jgi:hypothetical protein
MLADRDSVSPPTTEQSRFLDTPKQQHRQEVQSLRDALEQAHGENLDLRRELDRRGRDTLGL